MTVWDPVLLTSAFRYGNLNALRPWIAACKSVATIVSAIACDQHWIPWIWRLDREELLAFVWCVSFRVQDSLQAFHAEMCVRFARPVLRVRFTVKTVASLDACGPMAVAFVRSFLLSEPLPCSVEGVISLHTRCRQQFLLNLTASSVRPWLFALGGDDSSRDLSALLRQHGVPKEAVQARVEVIVQRLGAPKVHQIMQAKQPWKELK